MSYALYSMRQCKIKIREMKDVNDDNYITKLWTMEIKSQKNQQVYKVINSAIIMDGSYAFGLTKYLTDYHIKIVEDTGFSYKQILKKSMKYIRLLNSCIVDEGRAHNEIDRAVFRGVPAKLFQNIEVGDAFRIVNWNWTSESIDIAKYFASNEGGEETIVKFNVKKGCYNAGIINKIGRSCTKSEEETLIPPYSHCKFEKKEEDGTIVLNLAYDNKDQSLDGKKSY